MGADVGLDVCSDMLLGERADMVVVMDTEVGVDTASDMDVDTDADMGADMVVI